MNEAAQRCSEQNATLLSLKMLKRRSGSLHALLINIRQTVERKERVMASVLQVFVQKPDMDKQ